LDPHLRGDDDFLQKISAKFFKKICYNQNLDPHLRGDDDFLQKISAKFFKKICHLLTGDSGSISNATKSLIWVSVKTLLCPKRGMFEHAA
jgi:hypothetical protein